MSDGLEYESVTVYTNGGAIRHSFLLDTGASMTLIPASLANSIGAQPIAYRTIQTANGTANVPVVRLTISVRGSPPTTITAYVIQSGVYALGMPDIQRFGLLSF
jgi:predicted aspartyl protease